MSWQLSSGKFNKMYSISFELPQNFEFNKLIHI
jgi:hypothetical protein